MSQLDQNEAKYDWEPPTPLPKRLIGRDGVINDVVGFITSGRRRIGSVGFGNASGVGKTAVLCAVANSEPLKSYRPVYVSFGNSCSSDDLNSTLENTKWIKAWIAAGLCATRRNAKNELEMSHNRWHEAIRWAVLTATFMEGIRFDAPTIFLIDEAQNLSSTMLRNFLQTLHGYPNGVTVVTGTFQPEAVFTSGRNLHPVPFPMLKQDDFNAIWSSRGLPDRISGVDFRSAVGCSVRVLHRVADSMEQQKVAPTSLTVADFDFAFQQTYSESPAFLTTLGLQERPISASELRCCFEQGSEMFLRQHLRGATDCWLIEVPALQVHCQRLVPETKHDNSKASFRAACANVLCGTWQAFEESSTTAFAFRLHAIGKSTDIRLENVFRGAVVNDRAEAMKHLQVGIGDIWCEPSPASTNKAYLPDYQRLIRDHSDCSIIEVAMSGVNGALFDSHILVKCRFGRWTLFLVDAKHSQECSSATIQQHLVTTKFENYRTISLPLEQIGFPVALVYLSNRPLAHNTRLTRQSLETSWSEPAAFVVHRDCLRNCIGQLFVPRHLL